MTLTLETAQRLIAAAFEAGSKQDVAVAVVVVDRGGRVLASGRHENVGYINLDVAEKKAVASVNFGAPTHAVLNMVKDDDLLIKSVLAQGVLSLLPGGSDIRLDGELIGAIGVAGGHYSQDQAIVEQALATIN
ncbi:heme-binding protein [Sphingobium sp. SCG-1]|uniref:GlcG/HbpS family heme-binding protein n=1 Tax=Sphingobium sp. SCG-1 TaxID=2072936 RepID=UPI000CD6AAFA|nr:heme-binding protein [Sphingobium sp. SCG-1]AUW58785.1 heme-binding protein [Sphingobium sp. SCG-1]